MPCPFTGTKMYCAGPNFLNSKQIHTCTSAISQNSTSIFVAFLEKLNCTYISTKTVQRALILAFLSRSLTFLFRKIWTLVLVLSRLPSFSNQKYFSLDLNDKKLQKRNTTFFKNYTMNFHLQNRKGRKIFQLHQKCVFFFFSQLPDSIFDIARNFFDPSYFVTTV